MLRVLKRKKEREVRSFLSLVSAELFFRVGLLELLQLVGGQLCNGRLRLRRDGESSFLARCRLVGGLLVVLYLLVNPCGFRRLLLGFVEGCQLKLCRALGDARRIG